MHEIGVPNWTYNILVSRSKYFLSLDDLGGVTDQSDA